MSDIYSTPNAPLVQPGGAGNFGSIDRALAGDYPLDIGAVLSEAWTRTHGCKWIFQVAFGIYLGIMLLAFGAVALIILLIGFDQASASIFSTVVVQLLSQLIYMTLATPAYTGLYLLGLRRAIDAPVRASQTLDYYGKIVPLLLTALATGILTVLGYFLLILPGIYLGVSYLYAPMLVAEKGLSPSDAMSMSRKAIGKKWFAMFVLLLVLGLINVLGMIPLGIGLIWTVPMSMIALGIVYRDMFGYEAATLADD